MLGLLTPAFIGIGASPSRAAAASLGTTRFILDGNRVYAELTFVRPDGRSHVGLAFVDTGTASMSLDRSLGQELQVDATHPLIFRVGAIKVTVPTDQVMLDQPQHFGSRVVEAVLPAGILQKYQVVIDYKRRTLTLAKPGRLQPTGLQTPFHINRNTGLIAVNAMIDGRPYAITIDVGSAWTWFRRTEVKNWLADKPSWARGIGAVGASNMMMVGDLEGTGLLARIPAIRIRKLLLRDVDILGPGKTDAFPFELFDWYSKKNALPVLGWIGGNVLKRYRLTIDYPHSTLYWLQQTAPDSNELNQIGLTLRAHAGDYFIAAVAIKDGRPTVTGVRPGDKLVSVNGMLLKGATWGAIFRALHGVPGARSRLVLERAGKTISVTSSITAF